jgi:hypothetical protein
VQDRIDRAADIVDRGSRRSRRRRSAIDLDLADLVLYGSSHWSSGCRRPLQLAQLDRGDLDLEQLNL